MKFITLTLIACSMLAPSQASQRGASFSVDVETTWTIPKSLKNAKWSVSKMLFPMEGLVVLLGLAELMSYSCVERNVRKMRKRGLKGRSALKMKYTGNTGCAAVSACGGKGTKCRTGFIAAVAIATLLHIMSIANAFKFLV
eukprot:scaffold1618_cov27-Cyclotella_meneghiniana.AAC.1